MKRINETFPELFAKTTEEFNGGKGGIWTSGETGVFDYWSHYTDSEMQKILDETGWYLEWHDAGTAMLYPS